MRNIRLTWAALIAGLTLLWLQAEPILSTYWPFFTLRKTMMQYTGILGIGVMSVGMLLALRPVRVEPWLGGLDKTYRLHKWLGITGLVITIVHWAWAKVPKWAVGWGWLEKPKRGPRAEETVEIFRFLREQRDLAESIGEWAFYAAVVLIAIALIKRFPYRHFFQTHRLMAVVYLLLVFHSVVLMNFGYWSQPVGPVMALLMAAAAAPRWCRCYARWVPAAGPWGR
jgi:predicted ferric reductase